MKADFDEFSVGTVPFLLNTVLSLVSPIAARFSGSLGQNPAMRGKFGLMMVKIAVLTLTGLIKIPSF
jgi:hypothetical protein